MTAPPVGDRPRPPIHWEISAATIDRLVASASYARLQATETEVGDGSITADVFVAAARGVLGRSGDDERKLEELLAGSLIVAWLDVAGVQITMTPPPWEAGVFAEVLGVGRRLARSLLACFHIDPPA